MAGWDDVRRIALALPETDERSAWGDMSWAVKGKGFVWERTLRKKERAELGDAAPDEPVLAAHVADEGVKTAMIAADPDVYFTVSHFDGYPAVLALLDRLGADELEELIVEAWLCRAPVRVRRAYLGSHPDISGE